MNEVISSIENRNGPHLTGKLSRNWELQGSVLTLWDVDYSVARDQVLHSKLKMSSSPSLEWSADFIIKTIFIYHINYKLLVSPHQTLLFAPQMLQVPQMLQMPQMLQVPQMCRRPAWGRRQVDWNYVWLSCDILDYHHLDIYDSNLSIWVKI